MRERVLLVDDDPGVRKSLGGVLVTEGYVVIPASDGKQAIEAAGCKAVDLVLLDLNMPLMNGWDAFKQLTTEDPTLPIIIVTARSNQLFSALSAGVGALLEKPVEIPTLLKAVKELLAESREQRLARLRGKEERFFYHPSVARTSVLLPRHWGINE